MNNEKKTILDMVREGKITTEEGMQLLEALNSDQDSKRSEPRKGSLTRFLRIRVTGDHPDVNKVNVNVPLALLKVASSVFSFGKGIIPKEAREELEKNGIDLEKIDFDELIHLIDEGLSDGKIVDVEVTDPETGKMKVDIYVE